MVLTRALVRATVLTRGRRRGALIGGFMMTTPPRWGRLLPRRILCPRIRGRPRRVPVRVAFLVGCVAVAPWLLWCLLPFARCPCIGSARAARLPIDLCYSQRGFRRYVVSFCLRLFLGCGRLCLLRSSSSSLLLRCSAWFGRSPSSSSSLGSAHHTVLWLIKVRFSGSRSGLCYSDARGGVGDLRPEPYGSTYSFILFPASRVARRQLASPLGG